MKIQLGLRNEDAVVPIAAIAIVGLLAFGGCVAKKAHDKIKKMEEKRERERRRAETNEVAFITIPRETRFSAFVIARNTDPVMAASPIAQWETSTNLIDWEASEFPELNINETKRFFRTKQ